MSIRKVFAETVTYNKVIKIMCIELLMCIRYRRRKSYDIPGTESSAAFINKRVVSPTESDEGGRRNDIAMQQVDHKSMYNKCCINTVLFVYVCACVCVCV